MQSVISAAICLLSHDMSAWQQSVSLGAVRQLSCDVSAQLHPVGSDYTCQLSCQISCNLSAELYPVSSDDACHLSCNVLAELWSVLTWTRPLGCSVSTSTVFCQLGCDMSAQQSYVSSAAISQLTATCPVAVSSICLVRVKLLAQRHNAFNVAYTPISVSE